MAKKLVADLFKNVQQNRSNSDARTWTKRSKNVAPHICERLRRRRQLWVDDRRRRVAAAARAHLMACLLLRSTIWPISPSSADLPPRETASEPTALRVQLPLS